MPVTAIQDARAAMRRMDKADATHTRARRDRDAAIRRAAAEGLSAPQIYRALDQAVSLSLVRYILKTHDEE